MKQPMNYLRVAAIGISVLAALSAKANFVTVQELGIGANEIVNITSSTLGTANVYAGIVKLSINGGAATDGFCIDPFHWSTSGAPTYEEIDLTNGPKPPGGPMGDTEATKIEQLWAKYYSPTMNNETAAGLQIAIWDVIGSKTPGSFTLNGNDYGAQSVMLNGLKASDPTASLYAVTSGAGPGQDYVILIPNSGGGGGGGPVPDAGTTLMLLGGALSGLAIVRRKVNAR